MFFEEFSMQRRNNDDELDREPKSHIELEAKEQSQTRIADSESQRRARLALGNLTQVAEDTKDGALVGANGDWGGPSAMDAQDFARHSHTFQQLVEHDHWRKNVSFGERIAEPEQMRIASFRPHIFKS